MSKSDFTLTQARLKEVLHYDPKTGLFTRRVKTSNSIAVGMPAGHLHSSGYRIISVGGELRRAHRLAWLWMTGSWPSGQIDHINGRRHDNRFCNLREVTAQLNTQNLKSAQVNNKTGLLGVTAHGPSWRATITVGGKQRTLGSFPTANLAHVAYLKAKRAEHTGNTL